MHDFMRIFLFFLVQRSWTLAKYLHFHYHTVKCFKKYLSNKTLYPNLFIPFSANIFSLWISFSTFCLHFWFEWMTSNYLFWAHNALVKSCNISDIMCLCCTIYVFDGFRLINYSNLFGWYFIMCKYMHASNHITFL